MKQTGYYIYDYTILLNFSDQENLKRSNEYVALSSPSIYYTWKNIESSYKNKTFKICVNVA